jgi:glycosyltransferase involved in cell wall biosynthesis
MRNVLVVSYYFPPDASVGALRPQKFVKYLPEQGWQPHVLTVLERYHPDLDPDRLRDVHGARIVRTTRWPGPRAALLGVRGALLTALGRRRSLAAREERDARMTFAAKQQVASGWSAAARRTLLSLCWVPDEEVGWLPVAVARGLAICRRERIDCILTTSPPQTGHLVGLWLKRLTGLRWVADFRDPWARGSGKPRFVRSALSDRLDARLERAVVRRADRVVLVNDASRDEFVSAYPGEPAAKFVRIWNGFDGDDFDASGVVAREPRFTIAHVGTLYRNRSARQFLTAVARLLHEGRIGRSDLQVRFVGYITDGHQVDGLVAELGLSDVVTVVDPVSHREALRWMRRADLLVLFGQREPYQIAAKTFEYLAAGPPVLAIAGDGPAADLIRKADGWVCADDAAVIQDAIEQGYLRYRARPREAGSDAPWRRPEVQLFERRALTAQLAGVLGGGAP